MPNQPLLGRVGAEVAGEPEPDGLAADVARDAGQVPPVQERLPERVVLDRLAQPRRPREGQVVRAVAEEDAVGALGIERVDLREVAADRPLELRVGVGGQVRERARLPAQRHLKAVVVGLADGLEDVHVLQGRERPPRVDDVAGEVRPGGAGLERSALPTRPLENVPTGTELICLLRGQVAAERPHVAHLERVVPRDAAGDGRAHLVHPRPVEVVDAHGAEVGSADLAQGIDAAHRAVGEALAAAEAGQVAGAEGDRVRVRRHVDDAVLGVALLAVVEDAAAAADDRVAVAAEVPGEVHAGHDEQRPGVGEARCRSPSRRPRR